MKNIKFLLIIFSLILLIPLLLMIIYTSDNQDVCLDTGFCKEGIELNTAKGKIHVNKQICIENNGIWVTEKNACNFSIQLNPKHKK